MLRTRSRGSCYSYEGSGTNYPVFILLLARVGKGYIDVQTANAAATPCRFTTCSQASRERWFIVGRAGNV